MYTATVLFTSALVRRTLLCGSTTCEWIAVRWALSRFLSARRAQDVEVGKALLLASQRREKFEKINARHQVSVMKLVQFLLLWVWDMSALLSTISSSRATRKRRWETRLLTRALALTIHEGTIKLKWFLDPAGQRKASTRRAVRSLPLRELFEEELNELHRELTLLSEPNTPLLGGIRDNAFGHRDPEPETQMLWIRKANIGDVEPLALAFLTWAGKALVLMTAIVENMPVPPSDSHISPKEPH